MTTRTETVAGLVFAVLASTLGFLVTLI